MVPHSIKLHQFGDVALLKSQAWINTIISQLCIKTEALLQMLILDYTLSFDF